MIEAIKDRMRPHARIAAEAVRYFLGACIGLGADWATWLAVHAATGSVVGAQLVSRPTGAVVSYLVMRHFTFRAASGDAREQGVRFAIAALASMALSVALVSSLATFLPPILAKVASDGITFAVNYGVMRFWVFRK
jgi:putative flippase GtrA